MTIIVPKSIREELTAALKKAGPREAGGVLMGEQVADGLFKICRITVQTGGGSLSTFIRSLKELILPLNRFFEETKHDYRHFNYLGEWHSHPSYSLVPSERDARTMWEIVEDSHVGARFAVLLIVRLDNPGLSASATVFPRGGPMLRANLMLEGRKQ